MASALMQCGMEDSERWCLMLAAGRHAVRELWWVGQVTFILQGSMAGNDPVAESSTSGRPHQLLRGLQQLVLLAHILVMLITLCIGF